MNEVFVIGDSNASVIREGFKARGWKTYGGTIQAGVKFEEPFFEPVGGGLVFKDERAQLLFSRSLEHAGAASLAELAMPIVSTVGFNTARLAGVLIRGAPTITPNVTSIWSSAVVDELIQSARAPAIAFYKTLPSNKVYAVLSPQRASVTRIGSIRRIEAYMIDELSGCGINILDVRDITTDEAGVLRAEFWSNDPRDKVHGNAAYGALVADALSLQLIGAKHAGDASP
jgi:hypothetical protein